MPSLVLILKSANEAFQVGKDSLIDTANINAYIPKRGVKSKLKKIVEKEGFEVFEAEHSLNIVDDKSTIKKVFNANINEGKQKEEIEVSAALKNYIYKIEIPELPEFY